MGANLTTADQSAICDRNVSGDQNIVRNQSVVLLKHAHSTDVRSHKLMLKSFSCTSATAKQQIHAI